jgi:hypothetical protein
LNHSCRRKESFLAIRVKKCSMSSNPVNENVVKRKGGETMHFRHFLIPTLMVGAALLLPGNAFAEKSDNGSLNSNKEIVQTSEATKTPAEQATVPSIAQSAKQPIEKTVPALEQADRKETSKPLPSNAAPKQAASPQPASEIVKVLPEQANGNGYGLSDTKKADKTVNNPGQEKKAADSGMKTEQPLVDDMAKNPPAHEVKVKVEPPKSVPRLQPQEKGADISNSNMELPSSPVPAEQDKSPSSKEELPPVDQAPNTPQRSANTGGSSSDRISTGTATISLVDKWFDWNKYFEMKLVQPFLTRDALLNTQWVNAPPSPPPQAAPFLKTVTRS